MKHSIWIFTLLGFIIFVSAPGNAEEGGGGHYTPAVAATLIELLPTEPGFILQPIYLHFSGDAGLSRTFPIAGRITSDLDAEVNSITLGALYTFDKRVFGSRYTVGIYAPYIWQQVTATFTTDRRTVRREDMVDGFGDITLLPVGLAWEKGNWQFGGRLPIYAPTGSYEVGRLANPGLNYWTFDPTVSLS